ncbi:hypothetical protein HPB47_018806, partial [Ixodes persulcatus]
QLLRQRTTDFDSIMLRELFLRRLPTNVRMVLLSPGETNPSKLAELDCVSAVQAELTTSDQLQHTRDGISRRPPQ